MLSETVENYIKAIYELQEDNEKVSTSALAEKLRVAPSTITALSKRLQKNDPPLIIYKSHYGVSLTDEGYKHALSVIRKHRLLELFLLEVLKCTWDEVHKEAERLEHSMSDTLIDRIDACLGYPKFDPHGDPIPSRDGHVVDSSYTRLTQLTEGQSAIVKRVRSEDPELLKYLSQLGIIPNICIKVLEKAPLDGPLFLQIGHDDDTRHVIGYAVAEEVMVVIK